MGVKKDIILEQNRLRHYETYMAEHGLPDIRTAQQEMESQAAGLPRDFYMDYKDLCNLEAEIDRAEWKANTDEAQSVRMWVETHPQNVLHYSEYDGTTDKPFEVVVTTPELVKLMVQHGHKQALLIDSTFGTNSHKYPLFTAGVMDGQRNFLPIAWLVTSQSTSISIQQLLSSLLVAARQQQPAFEFGCVLCDDDAAEHRAIRAVMPNVPILLCLFHVMTAWAKALQQKVKEKRVIIEMSKDLAVLARLKSLPMASQTPSTEECTAFIEARIEDFLAKYSVQVAFVQYFKRTWALKAAMWCQLFRNFDHQKQETTGGLESFNRVMKDKFLSDKKAMLRGRRVDWLLHCLIFKVAAYYLHNQHRKHAEFSRNRILEIEAIGIVKRAAEIPDEAVQLSMDPAAEAVVQGSDDKAYTICNPGTADATCTCTSFLRGSVCKHIVKVAALKDLRLSWGLFVRYLGTCAGTHRGGLKGLYASLQDAEAPTADPSAATDPSVQIADCAPAEIDYSDTIADTSFSASPASVPVAASSQPQPSLSESERSQAQQAAISEQLTVLLDTFEPNDARWARLLLLQRQFHTDLIRLEADGPSVLQPAPARFLANPLAPKGDSLKRLKSCLERGRNRSQAPLRSPINQPSPSTSRMSGPAEQISGDTDHTARAQSWPVAKPRQRQLSILGAAAGRQTLQQRQRAENASARLAPKNEGSAAEQAFESMAAAPCRPEQAPAAAASSDLEEVTSPQQSKPRPEHAVSSAEEPACVSSDLLKEPLACSTPELDPADAFQRQGADEREETTVATRRGRRIQRPSRLQEYD